MNCVECGNDFTPHKFANNSKRCPACRRDYQREYKRQYMTAANKFCDCGNKATTVYAGERCCERCKAIELRRDEEVAESNRRRDRQRRVEWELCSGWVEINRRLTGKLYNHGVS